jgi:hypothetical protein
LISVPIRTSDDFDGAFAAMMQRQPNAFVTTNDDLMLQHIEQIIDFAARHRSALQSGPAWSNCAETSTFHARFRRKRSATRKIGLARFVEFGVTNYRPQKVFLVEGIEQRSP